MKKAHAILLALLFAGSVSFALDVDRKEIDTGAEAESITFINYTGPQTEVSTAAEITAVGSELGSGIKNAASAGDRARYYVIHAVDSSVTEGFDADILILGPKATVDHIDNLRRIIAGYLSAAYGYDAKDSRTLATFITVYNAVYRGKIDTFKARYKPVVTKNLTAEKAGLSVRYSEWPGQSQIVIPLSDTRLAGTISTIDTTSLTEKDVIGKIKEDTVNGTDTRKDMAELKERESDAAQGRAETAKVDAAQAREDAAVKTSEATAAEKEAAAAKTEAQKAEAVAKAAPEDKAAQEKAAAAATAAEEKAETAAEKKTEAAAAQDTVAKKEEEIKADEELAATKQEEAKTERKEIASDVQQELDKKDAETRAAAETALASAMPAFALRIIDEGNLLSELVLVNLNDASILKTSPLNTIRGRTLFDTGAGLIAIAGKKGGSSAIRLVLVDPETLEMTKQGADAIAEQSMLVQGGNDYYAVIENASGSFVIGRFDKNLEAKAKSAVEVKQTTAITVTAKGILVQDSSGAIRLLRATDLTDVTK